MDYPITAILAGMAAAAIAATLAASGIARAGFPLPPAGQRFACIDGLRGYLALSVLVHHFVIWIQATRLGGSWAPPSVHLFNQLGAGAVALFFMTTGFVFYPRVLAGFRACPWLAVLTGRVFRIVPLVAVSVAVVTVIIAARTGHGIDAGYPKAAAQWILTWGEPPLLGDPDSGRLNAYVLWSLWYEWVFYLLVLPVCALAMDLIRGRAPSWVVPAALLAAGLAARGLHLRSAVPIFLPLFAAGMLAYECQSRESLARLLRTPAATALAAGALGIGVTAYAMPYTQALPLFAFFFTCVACGNDMSGLLRTRGALVLGECSYGIYLLHGILLSLLFVDASALTGALAVGQLPVLLPLVAVAAALVASAANLIVERPAIDLGRRIVRRGAERPARKEALELGVAP